MDSTVFEHFIRIRWSSARSVRKVGGGQARRGDRPVYARRHRGEHQYEYAVV